MNVLTQGDVGGFDDFGAGLEQSQLELDAYAIAGLVVQVAQSLLGVEPGRS